jgi:hypothetical protein
VITNPWRLSHRADPDVGGENIADRHYNRQTHGAPQFVPPGRCICLKTGTGAQLRTPNAGGAYWVTSYPFAEYVKHAWAGAWMNTAFRNEGAGLSSELIRAAIAMTRAVAADKPSWDFGKVPPLGLVTFVDPEKTRRKRDPGRCYRRAGFEVARCPIHYGPGGDETCMACKGMTEAGLVALQLLPDAMPEPSNLGSPLLFAPARSPSPSPRGDSPTPAAPAGGGGGE